MKDELGERMKSNYENITRIYLPRRTYTIIRIDGKAFHTYTARLEKPFDAQLISDMDDTAKYLCESIQGVKFGFVQSDEISLLLTDFEKYETCAWFNGNIQKIVSVSSSIATAKFNQLRLMNLASNSEYSLITSNDISVANLAMFDSRTFTIPSINEVINYFIWRQQDTVRNSIQSLAQSLYGTNRLKNKNSSDLQELCFQKGHNWNDLEPKLKRGRFIEKIKLENGRTEWVSNECPIFTQEREFLFSRIPNINDF